MIIYALLSADDRFAVDLYVRPEDAEQALADCLCDEPEWIDLLSVEPIDLSEPLPVAPSLA